MLCFARLAFRRARFLGLAGAISIVAAGALSPTTALAQPPPAPPAATGEIPVVVLTAGTLDAFEQADIFTNALKLALKQNDAWMENELPKPQALLFLTSSLGCNDPPDAACEQKIGDELKVDAFVWSTIKKENDQVSGELHLWVRGQDSRSTTFAFPATTVVAGDPSFVNEVEKTFMKVAGPTPAARITLRVGTLNGTVTVGDKDPVKLVNGTAILELDKGTHRIVVEVDGFEDVETTIEVKAREVREVTLSPKPKSQGGVPIQKILGFTAIGVGVVAAGVATYAGVRVLQINSELEPYKLNTDPNYAFKPPDGDTEFDGCEHTGDNTYPNIVPKNDDQAKFDSITAACSEGKTMQTLTLAFWPIAGAFAGAGIILLATADWSGSSAAGAEKASLPFLLVPNFGPTGGDVTFATWF